jgi:flagellar basal body-associated protein FliL
MKQKDLALIMIMVFISIVVALVVSRWVFSSPQNREQTAEVVDVISPDFSLPSSKYFNAESINPTQQIEIGDTNNPNPFNAASE